MLRGKLVTISLYIKKEQSQISNLTFFYLKSLEDDPSECKISGRKEIIKIRVEINELESGKTKLRKPKLVL